MGYLLFQVMENGQITQMGTYEELLKSGTAFEQLVNAHQSSITIIDSVNHEKQVQMRGTSGDHMESRGLQLIKQSSEAEISVKVPLAVQLTEDEEKEVGDLGWKPYIDYFHVSKGYFLLASVFFAQTTFVVLQSLSTYWLAVAVQMHNLGSGILVGVYAAISIISCLFVYTRTWMAAHLGLRASKAFFSGFMDSVFKAPMLFFDSTPVGRILTRVRFFMSHNQCNTP